MSNATASAKPHACANRGRGADATRGTGQQQARADARRPRRAAPVRPPRSSPSTSSAIGARLPRYGAHTARSAASARGGDQALVLAELGGHLVRAHDLVTTRAEHRRHRAFVSRVEVGVEQAHRDRVDCTRRRGPRRRTARARGRARRVGRPPRTGARAARAAGTVDVGVVERRARLPRDLDHVGEAARRHQGDATETAFEQRVGRHRGAVGEHRQLLERRREAATGVDAPRATDRRASTAPCAPSPSSVTTSVNVPPVSTPTRMAPNVRRAASGAQPTPLGSRAWSR